MSATRIKQLDKILTSRAHAKVNAQLDAEFALLQSRAANDPDCKVSIGGVTLPKAGLPASKVLADLRQSLFKAAAPKAIEAEIEALLARTQPIVSLDQLLYPEMINLSPAGDRMPADRDGHVAVLLPAYGLIYDARLPAEAKNWQHAIRLGLDCDHMGESGWQLFDAKEAELTINRAFRNPAVNKVHFPHTPTNRIYWTRTPLVSVDGASSSGYAFCVNFSYGDVHCSDTGCAGFARFVRRVPASQV
jgi:hypothetical protein